MLYKKDMYQTTTKIFYKPTGKSTQLIDHHFLNNTEVNKISSIWLTETARRKEDSVDLCIVLSNFPKLRERVKDHKTKIGKPLET